MSEKTGRLSGKRVVVTRHGEGNSRLATVLEAAGATVWSLPLIEVHAASEAESAREILEEFGSYEWLVLTSRNGVRHFFELFFGRYADIRSLGFIRIAAVGSGTAEALREYRLQADLVAERATAEDLGEALAQEQSLDNVKVLVITGNRNREALVKRLWDERAIVDRLQVYRTELRDLSGEPGAMRFRSEGADALIFASSSAVQAFGEQAHHLRLEPTATVPALCSFGPVTSERMRQTGIPVHVEAESPGIEEITTALVEYFEEKDAK